MQQRIFDFDQLAQSEPAYVAEATSLPPPEPVRLPPPLVRSDRQFTFDGLTHYEWPPAEHDRDTITVDRIREDIDGPSHRFLICRGDTVEVFFGANHTDIGEVTGISHRKQEVRIAFQEGSDGIWVETSRVYPTLEEVPRAGSRGLSLSEVIASVNSEPTEGFTEADQIPSTAAPYSFDDYKDFRRAFTEGSLSFTDYQSQFDRLLASQESLTTELRTRFNAKELSVIASRMGSFDAKRSTKVENAHNIYSRMLSSFVLDGVVSYAMGERYEDAVKLKVKAVTLEEYEQAFSDRRTKSLEHEKALSHPETYFEFRTFLQNKSEADLSDEQLSRYDALHADMTRDRRAAEIKTTVEQFKSSELESYEFHIKQGFHDKRQCPVWIVQLSTRVERATFSELNRKAKMLGGWYSSFKKADAGFQFLEAEKANRFASLLSSDADRADVLEARKDRREMTASERLHELASELTTRAAETIDRSNDSLQNTARRADIQAGVRGRAYADQALARTMHSIAEALSKGEAKYLDGIRHKTHIETLDSVLYLAKWPRVRATQRQNGESTYAHRVRADRIEDEQQGPKDVRFAEYPYPHIYRRNLGELVNSAKGLRGVTKAAEKVAKRLSREKEDFVTLSSESDIETLADFLGRAKTAGLSIERVETECERYHRLQRANIRDIHELRAALREYISHRAEARGDDPVKVAERELIGKKLPGFFPTPMPVIERMLELADIAPNHSILEPSCGKGDIIDAVKHEHPDVMLHAIEMNRTLSDVLAAKGHAAEFGDFLEHNNFYDRVVMNPPFENGHDMDHVRHAFSLLKPGGRLVSVMCEGPFFRSDKKSEAFREWLEDVSADVEALPDNSFTGVEAFRETGVRTRLVTINKGGL